MRIAKIAFLVAMTPLAAAAQPDKNTQDPTDQDQTQMQGGAANKWSGQLGVAVMPLNNELRAYFGAPADGGLLVAHVEQGSVAEKAGLKVGDVITMVNSQKVTSARDIESQLSSGKGKLSIQLIRDKQQQTLTADLGAKDDMTKPNPQSSMNEDQDQDQNQSQDQDQNAEH
jgi:C-terminal processing protease CtpA/Prc